MKKLYLNLIGTACLAIAMSSAVQAEVLQPAEALGRALSQENAPLKAPSGSAATSMKLTATFNANDGLPAA